MPTATVTSKGQITLPKEVREVLRVDTGDLVDFVINDQGQVTVHSVSGDVRRLRGMLKRPGQRPVSVEEMNEGILRHHARKR
ncbi:MAG TPA: type II toxin-antitoxin system PrlF family antitoxin [Thermoanaerobaculia bacterium]